MKTFVTSLLMTACSFPSAHAHQDSQDRPAPKKPNERFSVHVSVDEGAAAEGYRITELAEEVVDRMKKRKKWILVTESRDKAEVLLEVRRHQVRQEHVTTLATRVRYAPTSRGQEAIEFVDTNYISERHYLRATANVLGTARLFVAYDGRKKNASLRRAASELAEDLEQYLKDNYWSLVDRRRALASASFRQALNAKELERSPTTHSAAKAAPPSPSSSGSEPVSLSDSFPLLPKYLSYVNGYIRGDFRDAPRRLSSLTPHELDELASAFLAGDRTDTELKAAALLHTEYVLSVAPRPPLSPGAARTNAYHLDLARRYAHAIDHRDTRIDFLKKWHLAVGYRFHADLEATGAVSMFAAGLALFPNDPELAFALGAFHESWGALKRDETALLRAQSIFEALAQTENASKGLDIRLAHVLLGLNREDEARSYLDGTNPNGTHDDSVAVAAWMLKGELAQRSKDWKDAIVAFQAARELDPACQVCTVALSQAYERVGKWEESQNLVTRWLQTSSRREEDAWWQFLLGRSTEHARRLAALRQEIRP